MGLKNSFCFNPLPSSSSFSLFITLLVVLLSRFVVTLSSIGCFKCVSINGNYPACDDPFHNNYTVEIFEAPCMGGRKGRNGLFPATACIKITGVCQETGQRLMVRSCALDSGTLTTDTELIRMSHCGGFVFNDTYYRGCVQSCDDADGCNSGRQMLGSPLLVLTMAVTSILMWRQRQRENALEITIATIPLSPLVKSMT